MTQNKTPLQLVIRDITVTALEVFAGNTDAEQFGKVSFNHPADTLVDFRLNVLLFAVDGDTVIIEFPNHNTGAFKLNNDSYYVIEVY